MFQYAIVTDRAANNPAVALHEALPPVKQTHPAVTDPAAFGGLLRASDGYEGGLIIGFGEQIGILVTSAWLASAPCLESRR